MISLALDTATRTGSVALASDNTLVGWLSGDPERTHGERLPGDLLACLVAHAVTLADVDLFAVCTGPGSFTGLRVGLATMQGLALAAGRPLVGIPTLEALAHAGLEQGTNEDPALVIPWMDAQRGETFGAAYHVENRVVSTEHQPAAAAPAETLLKAWAPMLQESRVLFVGDAVERTQTAIKEIIGPDSIQIPSMPPLAPTVALLAHARAAAADAPHAIRPVYVRRPDAELARERQRSQS